MGLQEQLRKLLIQISQALSIHKQEYQSLRTKVELFLGELEDKFRELEKTEKKNSQDSAFVIDLKLSWLMQFVSGIENGSTSSEQTVRQKTRISGSRLKLDLFVMEIDNSKRIYNSIKIKQTGNGQYIKEIGQLLLTQFPSHVKKIDIYCEITQKTSICPAILKPIVFQLLKSQKFVFVFETKQYLKRLSAYEQSDRFFVFVLDQFYPTTVIEMAKKIVKMEYADRFWLGKNSYQLDYSIANLENRKSLKNDMLTYLDFCEVCYFVKDGNLKLQKLIQLKWYLRYVHTYTLLSKISENQAINVSLLAIVLYYVLRDFKVIMVGTKETRHIMSETIMGLKTALQPMQYSYPIIFASISEHHNNFFDAPVPSLLMMWGSKQLCEQIISNHQTVMTKPNAFEIPSILIDLNSKVLLCKVPSQTQVSALRYIDYTLRKVQINGGDIQSSAKRGPRETMMDKAHNFLFQELMEGRSGYKQLQQSFRQTYMFKNYQQMR